ncbi:RecQ family ATP-dependent DNA helicase [Massilia sp. S19_KUP03_FR1]|uniref:RecQ family ATP-dependent DNA helicase n=1 Tax=Massilia sp. S19_KUP03_FR1 TaxID=3025503 RepID=UPI002FCD3BDF
MTRYDTTLLHNGQLAMRRHTIRQLLRSVFHVERLRGGQQQVIDSVLDGRDTLAIMPTGSGKSLCYQVPARLLGGLTVVISPLISLMKDQQDGLLELGVHAVLLNSTLTRDEEDAALASIGNGCEILFCTPERFTTPAFLAVLVATKVTLVVVDEAHCISHWGHDFRPAYLQMAASIDALGKPPVLALTATATDDVIRDIGKQLGRPRMKVINTGIYRQNLHYNVVQVTSTNEKYQRALALVRATEGVGIIYAATVKVVEEMYAILREAGESVTIYHGKLAARERKAHQDLFMDGAARVMVATNAFGMGIDKSDTRFVVHLQIPPNLEAYYQESGRAGRDGLDATCTLLFLQDDKRIQQFFLAKHYPDVPELAMVYETVRELAQDAPVTFARVDALAEEYATSKLKICLKMLKDGKLLKQNRKLEFSLTAKAPDTTVLQELADIYALKQEHDKESLESMVSYAVSGFCRWKVLLDYFSDEAPGFDKCCKCDNCRNPPVRTLTQELPIRDDEFDRSSAIEVGPMFAIGDAVKVAKYDAGSVAALAGDQVTIAFPDGAQRTFMADFVTAVHS